MSTIIDVERLSGVSKSTISRYLRGQSISNEKRLLVEKAIVELDYNINPLASGLKTNKTNTIGIVIPQITDPFFPPIIKRLEKRLRDNGYRTLISNYDENPLLEVRQVRALIKNRVDGIILVTSSKSSDHIKECMENKIPIILMDRDTVDCNCDTVMSDHYQATYDALSIAIRMGHRKIGIIRGQEGIYTDEIRYKAYVDVLKDHDISYNANYVVRAENIHHDACREFMRLLNLEDPITLVFASNIYLSLGILEGIINNGVKVPEDVSVLSFDRVSSFPFMYFVKSIKPEFACIYQPLDEIADKTVDLLIKRIGSKEVEEPQHIIVKTSIIMTGSIKPLCTK